MIFQNRIGGTYENLKSIILTFTFILITTSTTYAAEVPRESVALHISDESISMAEMMIADVLTEVHMLMCDKVKRKNLIDSSPHYSVIQNKNLKNML